MLLSIDTNFKEYFSYNKQKDAELERKALNQPGGPAVAGAEGGTVEVDDKKSFKLGGLLLGAGALAATALKSAGGLATMGVAISAFFGGLVAGDMALDYLDADLSFSKINHNLLNIYNVYHSILVSSGNFSL